jgi:hypothetical protein
MHLLHHRKGRIEISPTTRVVRGAEPRTTWGWTLYSPTGTVLARGPEDGYRSLGEAQRAAIQVVNGEYAPAADYLIRSLKASERHPNETPKNPS